MKTHRKSILLGLGLLGATCSLGTIQPAQAAPTYEVLTGRVTRDYVGNGFLLITDRGSTYRVRVIGGEPRRLSVGDRVRVAGAYWKGAFQAEKFSFIRDR